jgi:tRNA G46 methylase TrmB
MLRRQQSAPWRSPLHGPTVEAFARLQPLLALGDMDRLVLDSGCGTGSSTRRLAVLHPGCVVIGVDRSAHRLARGAGRELPLREGNCLWLRGELATFWRLARAAGWRLWQHYLLYPNPWPKPGQLGRRWHAHPVFPDLLALGGRLEMRCNWRVYAEEFAWAGGWLTGRPVSVEPLGDAEPLSPFEAKYAASGHSRYRVTLQP